MTHETTLDIQCAVAKWLSIRSTLSDHLWARGAETLLVKAQHALGQPIDAQRDYANHVALERSLELEAQQRAVTAMNAAREEAQGRFLSERQKRIAEEEAHAETKEQLLSLTTRLRGLSKAGDILGRLTECKPEPAIDCLLIDAALLRDVQALLRHIVTYGLGE
jgi:hypothetical protein